MKTILAGALLTATLIMPTAPANAAPACEGRGATLVGKPGNTLVGTAGPDVVVTNGASRVDTMDGDDLVCVTGATKDGKRVAMDTGPGNDRVRVASRNKVRVFLGDGDDSFVGGPEEDVVFAGYPDNYDFSLIDTGTDTITTGPGDDVVRSHGAADSLELGKGADVIFWTGTTGSVDGGRGHNRMILRTGHAPGEPPSSWVLDNVAERLTRDGVPVLTWTGFTDFTLWFLNRADESLLVLGGAAGEVFDVRSAIAGATVRAGRGDDTMRGSLLSDTLVGGPGRDRANGRGGEDLCVAEVRVSCESR
jgi:Ca2+-binding RTX toxin-like protein